MASPCTCCAGYSPDITPDILGAIYGQLSPKYNRKCLHDADPGDVYYAVYGLVRGDMIAPATGLSVLCMVHNKLRRECKSLEVRFMEQYKNHYWETYGRWLDDVPCLGTYEALSMAAELRSPTPPPPADDERENGCDGDESDASSALYDY